MGDIAANLAVAGSIAPSEAARQERRLADQLREAQTTRSENQRALIEREANQGLAAERADRQFAQRRADDREQVDRVLANETRRRDDVAFDNQRRIQRAEADAQVQDARRLVDEQRVAQQLREVEARQTERRVEERQRIARQEIDQRLSEQRLEDTRFRDLIDRGATIQGNDLSRATPRGSIVDIVG